MTAPSKSASGVAVTGADFLIVGGGVAGLSAGARLARHGRVVVLEAEEALGYHSSGRSATFSHFGIGNRIVRALTAHSRFTTIAKVAISAAWTRHAATNRYRARRMSNVVTRARPSPIQGSLTSSAP